MRHLETGDYFECAPHHSMHAAPTYKGQKQKKKFFSLQQFWLPELITKKGIKDSLSTIMQRAPKRRFRGPRNPKFRVGTGGLREICFHPSHPSVEWREIFLWNYEIYQGTIGEVWICKNVLFFGLQKRHSHTRCFAQLSTDKRDHTEKFYLYLILE